MSSSEDAGQSVGAALKKRRMLRGQSIETAHQHTRIPKKLLEALEADELEAFPARVYLRGFLKSYCDFLDVEFEPLWAKLEPSAGAQGGPDGSAPEESSAKPPSEGGGVILPVNESMLLPLLLLSCLVGAAGLIWFLSGSRGQGPSPSRRPSAAAAPREPAPPQGGTTMSLSADRDLLIRLLADGALRFEGRMPGGSSETWRADRVFSLRVSEPGAARVEIDGKPVDLEEVPPDSEGWRTLHP